MLIDDINLRMSPLLRMRVTKVSGLVRPVQEHEHILEACFARGIDSAVAALRSHIEMSKRELAAEIRRCAVSL